jgi:hypothetical protein
LANFLTVNLTFSLVFVNLILKVRGYFEWKIVVDNSRTDTEGKFQGRGFLGQYDMGAALIKL